MFPQIFGKYVLERELASGGMARVFLATLRGAGGFEKRLVVKQIRPELASDQSFVQRFVTEAKTTVELSHGNIVPVYELGAEQGVYFIAMELCAGVSLAELLRAGPVSPAEGAYIGVEICRALDYAHRKAGIVHRDVTPRNVMIDAEGMVKLIDFGIASKVTAADGGALFGSPGHMAPEQLRPGPVTPAADVFAVAVLLIELWTGTAPYRRESFAASAEALREPPPSLGRHEPRLAALGPLIASALSREPEARPQTAEELARPLREFLRQDDLGDLARRLGERVSGLSARLPCPTPAPAAATERAPLARGALPTRTFAARAALREWTAKIESAPPPASVRVGSAGAPCGSASAPCAPASEDSGVTAPSEAARESRRAPWRRSRAALVALSLGGALWVGLGGGAPSPRAADAPRPLPAAAREASHAGAAERAAEREPSPPPAAERAPVTEAPRPPPSPEALASPSAREEPAPTAPRARPPARAVSRPPRAVSPELPAHLKLTAEPPAWVELGGTRVGKTPLAALPVSPGRHVVRFVNPLLGERLEAVVSVGPEGSAHVHADFSSASPRLYVR